MIQAVLFDLGDTLWHFPQMPPVEVIRGETVHRVSELLRSWGVEPEGALFFLGRDVRAAVEKATDDGYWGDLTSPDYPALAKAVAAEKGLPITDAQAIELWQTWNLGGVFLGRQLYPGVAETLAWLKKRGYRIGSVTNRGLGGDPFREELQHHGVLDLFEVLSISCEVGYLKPHPRIFQHALDALDVAPVDSVMVGDSLRADVAGARSLGMTAIWKRNHTTARGDPERDMASSEDGEAWQPLMTPDFTIDNLWELTSLPPFAPE
jgi:HAD superfamily hydrolase (TIGR01549 family)